MAVTAAWFGPAAMHLALGDIAFVKDTVKVMLLSGYTFDQDNHAAYADVKANEIAAGNGYATRGLALGTKSVVYDPATNRARLKAANAVWTPANGETLSASAAIIYKDTGTDADSWLMGYVNFGANISAMGAPLTINWDATDGLLYSAVA